MVNDKSDRLLYPMMRMSKGYNLERVSWNSAMNRVTKAFKSIIDRFGSDSVGFYVSGQCLTEEYYLVNKLTKGFLQTNNIDTNSRLCMSSAVVGYKKTLGEDSVPITYEDIELADCFLIAGANPAWCHPILFQRIDKVKELNPNAKVIVVDPRRTESCEIADIHVQLNPGTDTTFFNAVARVLIESDQIDHQFVKEHTDGFENLRDSVFQQNLEESAKICGIEKNDINNTAWAIADSNGFLSFWAMGLNQSSMGVEKNLSLINLSLITGKIGKPGSGPFSLTGQPNAMGGREVGGLSNLLAAHKDLANPQHRKEVADFWGVDFISEKPGLTATQMIDSLNAGTMKAIWVITTNPVVSLPNAKIADAAFQKANFVVVQDISKKSDTVSFADVVLPAANWLEKEGTMTNSERRVTYLPKVIEPPGEARTDVDIILDFAKRMGFTEKFTYANTEEIFLEHAALTKGTNIDITGLNYSILKENRSIQWPFTAREMTSTPRLFNDNKFYTDNGNAKIFAPKEEITSEKLSERYPLILTTGRIRDQWHTMTKTGKVNKLKQHVSQPFLEIHPNDAEERGIEHGALVKIENDRGLVEVEARVTDAIKEGVVFLPMHWGKRFNNSLGRANNITSPQVDPISKEPDFKFAAVEVQSLKTTDDKKTIIVIGAGAASYKFIEEYRSLNENDEIIVFSKEESTFYNRIFLPDYMHRAKSWSSLQLVSDNFLDDNSISLFHNKSVQQILDKEKIIIDNDGIEHRYDKLVIASGSSAILPEKFNIEAEGIFTMRSKIDADAVLSLIQSEQIVGEELVIIGGGLLGIEIAVALNSIVPDVTLIHRSQNLMNKQLDSQASHILAQELSDQGIQLILNDEITRVIHDDQKISAIQLRSGKFITAKIIIFAIGTKPNLDFVQGTKLKVEEGLIVNEKLETNVKDIYALGEVAQIKATRYGIAKAAFEQATIAAAIIADSKPLAYHGTMNLNILKAGDIKLSAIGETKNSRPGIETIVFLDASERIYKKLFIENDRLIGAILVGDTSDADLVIDYIESKIELGTERQRLLRSNAEARPKLKGNLVCSCNSVGEENLTEIIDSGVTDLPTLCKQSKAGLGCGSCKPEVSRLLASHSKKTEVLVS